MKKLFGIIAAFLLCVTAYAQVAQPAYVEIREVDDDDDDGKFLLGFRYLPTFTDFDLKTSSGGVLETSFELGHGFGGLVGYNFNHHIGLQAEVIYSELTQKYRDQSMDQHVKLNYVSVPLMLTLHTNYSAPVSLNLAFGPQVSFNTGSKIDATDTPEGDSVHAVLAVNPADIGFAYGAGLDFGLGSSVKLSLGYRGVIGLVDISDDNQNLTSDEYYILDRSKVNTYAGYIGLTFGF